MPAHGRNTSHVACDGCSTSQITLKNLEKLTTWIHEELIVATKSKAQRMSTYLWTISCMGCATYLCGPKLESQGGGPIKFGIDSADGRHYRSRMTHICVSKLTIIGSDYGLSPGRRQASILTNAGTLLIENSGIFIKIHISTFKKIHLKMSSGNWRPFILGLHVSCST